MPIQVLVNVISVPVLAPGASVTLPHGLKQAGAGVTPTFVLPDRGTNIVVVSADNATVTFRNDGANPDSARFRCEYGLSMEVDHSILPTFWAQGLSGPGSGGPPTGAAGGDLLGSTYPNPVVKPGAIDNGKVAAGAAIAPSKIAPGPANTVLRGTGGVNAFGQVDLTTDVTGALPEANQADQTMGGDVAGTTGAATVVGLQGRPVDATAPTAGQLVGWSGSAWAPVSTTPGGGGGGGNTYYLNYSVAGQAPLPAAGARELDYTFSGAPTTSLGPIAVAQDTDPTPYTVMAQFVNQVGDPGATTIPPGIWQVGIYALANVATNTFIRFRLSKWDGVTLTDIALADFVQVTDTTAPAILVPIDVFVPATVLTASERLVITLEGQRDVAAARSITLFFEGTTVSHVHTSFNAPGGTGLVKVFNGVLQDPASLLTDADVAIGAGINPSKLSTNSVTITAGTGLSGGGVVALGGSVTLSLPNVGTPATYGSASSVPVLSTDAQGRVFTVTNTPISGLSNAALNNSSVTITAGTGLSGGGVVSLGGTVTLSLPSVGPGASSYGTTAAKTVSFTLDAQGRVTAASEQDIAIAASQVTSGTLAIARGGTNLSSAGGTANRVLLTTDGTTLSMAQVPNAALANASVTVTAGSGLSGGGTVALGGSITLSATTPSGGSGASGAYRAVSSADSFVIASDYLLNTTGASSFSVTLPSAVTATAGRMFILKHSGTGTITVATTGGQTIDGAASLTIAVQYSSYTFMSDGSNWIII